MRPIKNINISIAEGYQVTIIKGDETISPEIDLGIKDILDSLMAHLQTIKTPGELAVEFIEQNAPDEVLLSNPTIFDRLDTLIGMTVPKDKILTHGGELFRVRQQHLIQAHQSPSDEGMSAIYLLIPKPGEEDELKPWEDRWNMEPRKEGYMKDNRVTHPEDDVVYIWRSKIGTPKDPNYHEPSSMAHAAWEKEGLA